MKAEGELYDFLGSLEFSALPAATVESCLALILDHFGCALLGARMPWTQALRRVTSPTKSRRRRSAADLLVDTRFRRGCGRIGNDRHSTAGIAGGGAFVYGEREPVPATTAALVNGTAGHALDLDDLYFPAMSHPGCVIVPATVAAATANRTDGRRLITAIVGGYEVMGRIGVATGLRAGELGFHATGQHGPAGAAAAVAMLANHDARGVASAVGIAGSLGAGIKAFTNGPGMVKRLHAGRAAEAGVLAASLVPEGFDGPATPLTGKFGLVHILGYGEADVEALARGLSQHYVVDDIYLKPYAACGALHGAVRAADEIAGEIGDPALVELVVVGTSRRALDQNSDTDPEDAMSVQYSMECCVALGLLGQAHEPLRIMAVADDPQDPARVLARKVTLELDRRAEEAYPDPNVSRVDVFLTDGRMVSRYGECTPATSRGWDAAVAKFDRVTAEVLTLPARQRLVAAVRALASGAPVTDCLDAVRAA
ncbi:MmgE/PrpD family protein [Amycolatopsis pigmentata]|uniref:MmgE/PrpD family protein n=1 Tax=Amycolatopsis pigmentata TaxID=450801 RepID=A0ABW5FZ96_9PSEU